MKTVTIQKLSKTYLSGKEALKELSLTLSTGEVFGFLGPNGAGKTTTVKLLTGVLSPSGGSCEIMGVNPNIQPEKVHLLSGIVTEHAQMYDNLTGIENLMFYATAFGLVNLAVISPSVGTSMLFLRILQCLRNRII